MRSPEDYMHLIVLVHAWLTNNPTVMGITHPGLARRKYRAKIISFPLDLHYGGGGVSSVQCINHCANTLKEANGLWAPTMTESEGDSCAIFHLAISLQYIFTVHQEDNNNVELNLNERNCTEHQEKLMMRWIHGCWRVTLQNKDFTDTEQSYHFLCFGTRLHDNRHRYNTATVLSTLGKSG